MADKMTNSGSSTESGMPILSCRNLWKVYGEHPEAYFKNVSESNGSIEDSDALASRIREEEHIPACDDVSFDVHSGEIFVIMGLSGSGKSTVIRCLSRLVEPTHGQVMFEGQDLLSISNKKLIDIRRHKFGMVFQSFGLLPHLNVIDNIAFPLKLQGMGLQERRKHAARVIELVGLQGREEHFPRQLSGGQQQRVGIARSLAVEPELWFLDEPFSALDPLIRRQMQDEFLRIQQMLKKSIVFITHDFQEALRIADLMAIMRDGKIVQVGTPAELIINPVDDYVAEFSRDVPIARVLTARNVIDPVATSSVDAQSLARVSAATTVEELLPLLAKNPNGLAVENFDSLLGIVTANSVVTGLATGAKD